MEQECACGNVIPEARLKAVPNTTRCTKCQEKAERRGRYPLASAVMYADAIAVPGEGAWFD